MADDLPDAPWASADSLPDAPWATRGAPAPTLSEKLMQTWPARLAQSAWQAATLPGQVATGAANITPATPGMWSDEDEARLQATNAEIANRAQSAAAFMTPGSVASRAGEGILGVPTAARPVGQAAAPSIPELKTAAVAGYESPTVAGVQIQAKAGPRLAQEIQTNLNEAGLDENLAPKTFGIINKLNKVPETAEGEAQSFLTVDNLRSLRRTLGNAASSIDPTERLAAKSAQQHLDEFLSDLPATDVIQGNPKAAASILREANANYSSMKTAADLDTRMTRAYLRASAANSGMNVANTIRQRIADVVINPKLSRGFTPDELSQAQRIVEGTRPENALRMAGNVLGGGGGGLTAMWGLSGLATHGLTSLAPVAGYTLRKISNALAQRNVNNLSEAVRMRSPLGQQRQFEALGQTARPNLAPGARALTAAQQAITPLAQLPARAEAEPQEDNIPRPVQQRKAGGRVNQSENHRPIQNLPRGKDNLFIEPAKLTPKVQMMLDHNRERFAKHFNYADEFGSGDPNSYDSRGDYNCGRCNQSQGRTCLLIKKNNLNLKADSCRQWESIREGDPEMFLQREGIGPSAYGIAKNGQGFGCHRCPFSKPAKNRDDRGRTRWCGLGGFHQTPTACCELNGAETV